MNRAARLRSVAHAGQIVVSSATSELIRDSGVELLDLGEHRSRDLSVAERVFEARAEAAGASFVLDDSNVDAVGEICRCLDGIRWRSSWRRHEGWR